MAYIKCPKCKENYSNDMYSCMNGGGEDTRAYITVLDESYVLCPKCAGKLYKWLLSSEDILMRDKLVN